MLPQQNKGAFIVFGLCTVAAIGAVLFLGIVQLTGTRTKAYVDHCVVGGRAGTTCIGTWTRDGRIKQGTIEGADETDLLEHIDVRLSGARAYKRDLSTMVWLLVFGALFGAVTVKIRRGTV